MRIDRPVSSARTWPGMRSEYCWLPADGDVTTTRPYQVGVSFSAHAHVVHELGGRAERLTVPPGSVFSNGAEQVRWAEVSEPTEALEIYPDLELVRGAAGLSQSDDVEIDPVVAGRDATVLAVAAVLKRAHVRALELDSIEASSLTHRVVEHLADHYCHPRPRRARSVGRLDRVVVDRVARFVDEHLGEPLLLDDLAAQVHLSVYHFARAFRHATGMAPHQFVTMRRMERAKALLLSTHRSVPDIAHGLGYSNVSHFRRMFRRHTGFRPSDLRPR